MSADIVFQNLVKSYGEQTILHDLNLTVESGDFMVIYGPPSSGKSVLLRLLMGLERENAGRIALRGMDASLLSAGERNIGYVPQSFALYPHQSVFENIAYPLRLIGMPKAEIEPIVRRAAEMLKMESLLDKRPDQLSGGQKQRVAIARGIVKQTDIFVFDDPLAGLDFKLREQLVDDLKDLQEKVGFTFIYTTSDPIEAATLGKHIAILDQGRILEAGTPDELYHNPAHLRAMELFGFPKANFFPGEWLTQAGVSQCRTELFTFPVELSDRPVAQSTTGSAVVGVRPESIRIEKNEEDEWISLPARVLLREDLGGEEIIYLEINGLTLTTVVFHDQYEAAREDQLTVHLKADDLIVFDSAGGERMGKGGRAVHVGN
ncbi:ABC transporter ATP-binding protein [Brevibacillus centrosporus]|uniref:ABC transporter ATP-binding protein n=1 Tax=Brevibacillus centrosporus TaxID=54910 RepID=UPI002E20D819|nr:ABC transporter ATP-binding protein [Brevibacillus centrosporus]